MRVYYIKDNRCIDINREMADIGSNIVGIGPIVYGTLMAGHVICKAAVTGAGMYGAVKFGEFIGAFPQGLADTTCSTLYELLLNVGKLGR